MSVLITMLQKELECLQSDYLNLSGGKNQCVVGKEGMPSLELKQAEGAMQAVTDLLRCMKKIASNNSGEATLPICLAQVEAQWQKLSEISPVWVAYKQAGLDKIRKYRQH